ALLVQDGHALAGFEAGLGTAGAAAVLRARGRDAGFLRLLLLGFRGFRLLAAILEVLVLARGLQGRVGTGARRGHGGGRRGCGGDGAGRLLLDDAIRRDVGRRRLVAEDLVAVLVQPLPFGGRAQGRETQEREQCDRDGFHPFE